MRNLDIKYNIVIVIVDDFQEGGADESMMNTSSIGFGTKTTKSNISKIVEQGGLGATIKRLKVYGKVKY